MVNQPMQALMLALFLVLPVSALVARRLPAASVVRMVLAWVAIFALVILAVAAWQAWRSGDAGPGDTPVVRNVASTATTEKLT